MAASIDATQSTHARRAAPLAHDTHGDGAPALLIHGLGGERGGWKPVLAPLARHARCWAIDLPGFGDSPPLPPGTEPGPRQLADAVERFVAEQRLPRPLPVVGHSLGGWVALELARRGLASLVTALAPGGFWNEIERRYTSVVLRTCARLARRLEPHAPALLRRRALRAALLAPMMARAAHMPPEDAIAAVR
ncbi:MAG: alpha/beta fold hydrolase, partial [Planctomycetota bacterium]